MVPSDCCGSGSHRSTDRKGRLIDIPEPLTSAVPHASAADRLQHELLVERGHRQAAEAEAARTADELHAVVQGFGRAQAVLDETTDFVALAHPDGLLFYLNRSAAHRLGLNIVASPVRFIELLDAEGQAAWVREGAAAVERDDRWSVDTELVGADGRAVPASVLILTHRGPGGALEYLSAVGRDISERRALEARLTHQALHDALTGLPNRILFMDRLAHAQTQLGTDTATSALAVLYVDLDRFKTVNDSYGHDYGDRLLVHAATRIRDELRPQDSVARLGGDEFVVLLDRTEEAADAVQVADRILAALARPLTVDGRQMHVGASLGIAVGRADPDTMVRHADLAMYRAKERGRGRWEIFEPELNERAQRRMSDETALGAAIARQEFLLHYQPVVDLRTGAVTGFEALVRWQSPERGLVPPDQFIPLAEETGLINVLGRWVLEEACRQGRLWQLALGDPTLQVAVNVSARQFQQVDLVEQVATVLRTTGLPPASLLLEITETAVMGDPAKAAATMRRLAAHGVRFALDDFGQGYSSLGHLKRFPIDVVKIDKEFVDGLTRNASDAQIVQAVLTMAQALGLEVTAEGIEDHAQLDRLRTLGCNHGQGYLLSRPLPAAAATALLTARTPLPCPPPDPAGQVRVAIDADDDHDPTPQGVAR
ncbi:diguanylate cyclase (GGDEF) domain-containing protein [Friedmanniella luteola]|uniref:Diguanylate cyclase (GGDEF) domain-containing protein n=1 Tax=Friedmanniella luteola TaxID=546871 RepID=A0A1H1WLX7_9ACTN|nr:diguanylate cyclase (GGDEF) domain-containing protein [Friedmanniella luteola]